MNQKGYSFIALATITVVFVYLINDYVFRSFEGVSLANLFFWGSFGATVILSPFFLSTKNSIQILKNELVNHGKLVLLVSVLTAIGGFLWFLAIAESGAGVIALLEKSNVVFVFLLGIFFLQERVSRKELFFLGITVLGIFLVSSLKGEASSLGVIAILISQFLYSMQSFLIKKYGSEINSFFFSYIRLILILIFTGVFLSIIGVIGFVPMEAFLIMSLSQVFGIFLYRYFYFEAHKFFPISKISFLMLAESILVLFGGYILFGDSITIQKIAGAIFILVGLGLFLKEQELLKK